MNTSRRILNSAGAFTLIELLLVLSIIGLLMALMMPAVQNAREAARRTQCRNHLKQIGLGIHHYAEVHGCLPMGRVPIHDPRFAGPNQPCNAIYNDQSVLVAILPYVEQDQVYNAVNHSLSIFALENTTMHRQSIELYACPSDPGAGRPTALFPGQLTPMAPDPPGAPWQMAMTSYSACFGTFPVRAIPAFFGNCVVPPKLIAQCDGAFNDVHPITFASVTDGLSTTIFASEKAVVTFAEAEAVPIAGTPERNGKYVSGDFGDTLWTTCYPINAYKRVALGATNARFYSASSLHPGGVNVLMGDGSVRFIDENIDSWAFDPLTGQPLGATRNAGGWWDNVPSPGVWQALGTRSGGETIDQQF